MGRNHSQRKIERDFLLILGGILIIYYSYERVIAFLATCTMRRNREEDMSAFFIPASS